MLLLSVIIIAAVVIAWYVVKDMNQPLAEKITTTVHKVENKVEAVVEKVADVNKDGKVNLADAVEATKKAGKTAKITAEKVKKTVGRKKKSE